MARIVKGPKPGGLRQFIPTAFDNRESQDPVSITIKDPSEGEKRRLTLLQTEIGFEDGEMLTDASGSPIINLTLDAMAKFQAHAITSHVVKVENYTVREIAITTGADLSEHGETEFLAEVALEITTAMSLDQEKKETSEGLSISKPVVTDRSNGTAEVANDLDSINNVTVTDEQIEVSYT